MELTSAAFLSITAALSGAWSQPCNHGVSRIERIDGASTRLEESFFSDSACTKSSYVFASEGGSVFSGELLPRPEWPEGAKAVDFTFSRVTLVFQAQSLVDWARGVALCGKGDWEIGIPMDVTGRYCAFFNATRPVHVPAQGDGRFGIYRVLGGEDAAAASLQWGQLTLTYDGKSPDTRPRQWDDSQIYHRMDSPAH